MRLPDGFRCHWMHAEKAFIKRLLDAAEQKGAGLAM